MDCVRILGVRLPSWSVHFDLTVRAETPQIIRDLARIHALASVIRGIPIPPHVQHRLNRLNILRAARGTIGIEGTELSEEEVELVMDSPPTSLPLARPRARGKGGQERRGCHALHPGLRERQP